MTERPMENRVRRVWFTSWMIIETRKKLIELSRQKKGWLKLVKSRGGRHELMADVDGKLAAYLTDEMRPFLESLIAQIDDVVKP